MAGLESKLLPADEDLAARKEKVSFMGREGELVVVRHKLD